MNRQQLIDALARLTGHKKQAVKDLLAGLTEVVARELKQGKTVTITGFGTFRVSRRKQRQGVDPRDTNKRIHIPAVAVPAFTAGKPLKEAIRQK